MQNIIVNAAPLVVNRGTEDNSPRTIPRDEIALPQHCPKLYIYAEKGPLSPQLVSTAERNRMYGDATFDPMSKYFTHQALFANAMGRTNTAMIQRVIPDDIGLKARIGLFIDVLEEDLPVYERNPDGTYRKDNTGKNIIKPGVTVKGYRCNFISKPSALSSTGQDMFGMQTISDGFMVAQDGVTKSTLYPILEAETSFYGEYGNNRGISLFAEEGKSGQINTPLMTKEKTFPFKLAVHTRANKKTSSELVTTKFGSKAVSIAFKAGVSDPITKAPLSFTEGFLSVYQNIDNPKFPQQFGDFGKIAVYEDTIDQLVKMFHAKEKNYLATTGNPDFGIDEDDAHLLNFVTGVDTRNVGYETFRLDGNSGTTTLPNGGEARSIHVSSWNVIWADGATDGTLWNEATPTSNKEDNYNTLVKRQLEHYADPNHQVQDLADNVESIFYDSGFQMETKEAFIKTIHLRKDTFVVLGTHIHGDIPRDAYQEQSIAIALRTKLEMAPESEYFGTPVCRGLVMGRRGKITNSLWKDPISFAYELAIKASRYMGNSNGVWAEGKNFDHGPGANIDHMYDANVTWTSPATGNYHWSVGLNWVAKKDRGTLYFPALKTVYDDDTSILSSFITMMAICYCHKVAHRAHREFTGTVGMTNKLFVKKVNDFVNERLLKRFDGMFTVEADAQITAIDEMRGFSWALNIKIYGSVMKTVQTTQVTAYRFDALKETK